MKVVTALHGSGLLVLAGGLAYAQTASKPLTFDAVSVKLSGNEPIDPRVRGKLQGGPGTGSPGRITWTRVGMPQILMEAWGMRAYQIVGPDWVNRFDRNAVYTILATLPPETTKEEFHSMLQDLLVKRFQMVFHRETRNVIGFDLVVAQSGSKLKEAADMSEPDHGPSSGTDKEGFSLLPPGHGAGVVMSNGTHAKFQSYTIEEFVGTSYLRSFVQQAAGSDFGPIRDKTGLTRAYDFTLLFDNGGGRLVTGIGVSPSGEMPAAGPSGLPDIFHAIENQLGLKLVKVKDVPLEVLVIDRIEKTPVGN